MSPPVHIKFFEVGAASSAESTQTTNCWRPEGYTKGKIILYIFCYLLSLFNHLLLTIVWDCAQDLMNFQFDSNAVLRWFFFNTKISNHKKQINGFIPAIIRVLFQWFGFNHLKFCIGSPGKLSQYTCMYITWFIVFSLETSSVTLGWCFIDSISIM